MNDTELKELIDKINLIFYSQQYTVVQECMDILGIKVSEFEQKQIEFNSIYNVEPKEIYTKKIIEKLEKILTEEQKNVLYDSLSFAFIKYTSNDDLKVNALEQKIKEDQLFDYKDDINYYIIQLVTTISDDNYKIAFVNEYIDKLDPEQLGLILRTLNNDEIKLKYIDKLTEDYYGFIHVLLSLKDDNQKLKLYEQYKDELGDYLNYKDLVVSLNRTDLKLQLLEQIEYKSNLVIFDKILLSIDDEDILLSIWDKVDSDGKAIIIYKIKDGEKKYELFQRLNHDLDGNDDYSGISNIDELIYELPTDKAKLVLTDCLNIYIGSLEMANLLLNYNDDNLSLEVLKNRKSRVMTRSARMKKVMSSKTIIDNIDLFLELEQVKDKETVKKYMLEMYQTNNDIVYTIRWDLLDNKYVSKLGLEKINVIGSFKELTNLVLEMDDNEYEAFYRCLNHYIQKNGSTDWQYAAYQIMGEIHFNEVDHKNITSFITDFDKINIDNLLYILISGSDDIEIKSEDDINNYDKILKEKCDYDIVHGTRFQKNNAIFLKYFGLGDNTSGLRAFRNFIKNGMGRIYKLYHKDINLIEDEEIKKMFQFIETVLNSESDEELLKIYNEKSEFEHLDTYKLERLIKNEFLKLYNKELLQLSSLKQNADGTYEAGVEFSIIATSIGAFVKNNPENFKDNWNCPSLASQHFCASYIRNDMLGTAPIPHFMYGFCSMEPYSLLLAGSTDIGSNSSFVSKAYDGEEYLGPDSQINQTAYNHRYHYNEMDFRRIQNGQKKQPDYILVFRRKGDIPNFNEAKKASDDWGGLPIVIIDVDLCLENEHRKVKEMLNEYYNNPTQELFSALKTKILNNRVTDANFESDIDLTNLEKMIINEPSVQAIIN